MKIDEFIQQDILVFLDKELEQTEVSNEPVAKDDDLYLSRDYEEELLTALDQSNIVTAKKVLHDLKRKFDEVPVGTPEKAEMKFLLQSLYDKFRDHVQAQTAIQDMDQALTKMSRGEMPSLETPEPVARPPKSTTEDPAPKPSLESHATDLLDMTEKELALGNVKNAMQQYRKARADLLQMESSVPEELATRFTDVHARIKEAMTSRKTDHVHMMDKNVLLQLEREKHNLDEQLKAHDVKAAMHTYKRMRLLVQQLQETRLAERTAKKLVQIYRIIAAITSHTTRRSP